MPGVPSGLPTLNPPIYYASPSAGGTTNPIVIAYSNGILTVSGTIASGTMSTTTGGLFTTASAVAITFPTQLGVNFVTAPDVFTSLTSTNPGGCSTSSVTSTGFNAIPTSTITASTGTINYLAIGYWF